MRQPAPPDLVFGGDAAAGKDAGDLPQGRYRGDRSVRDQQREGVEHQGGRLQRVDRGQTPGGAGDLPKIAGTSETPGEQRGYPRAQIGLARQVQVERLEPLGGLEQQRRGVAAQARGKRDLAAQQVHPGACELILRPGLCHGQQAERGVKRAGAVLGLRRGHRPLRAARRVKRQPGGPLKEHGRRRQTTAALCPPGALLKFGGNFLIGARRGLGPVPGSSARAS